MKLQLVKHHQLLNVRSLGLSRRMMRRTRHQVKRKRIRQMIKKDSSLKVAKESHLKISKNKKERRRSNWLLRGQQRSWNASKIFYLLQQLKSRRERKFSLLEICLISAFLAESPKPH
jgi:hypothetical protein